MRGSDGSGATTVGCMGALLAILLGFWIVPLAVAAVQLRGLRWREAPRRLLVGVAVLYVVVIFGYLLAFVGLASVLRRGMALGVAYGIWGAGGVALTALLASALFGEPLTIVMGLGIGLVIVGVLLVETGSHPAEREP